MKRFPCFNVRILGYGIATIDILSALITLALCSYHLYNDFVAMIEWPQEDVKILHPLTNFFNLLADYMLVHNFSNGFYMILSVTLWIKVLINFVVAVILMDGIRKQRLICIAPWIINTCVSMIIEILIFIFMEIKLEEIDASMDRRIVRSIIFGIFLLMNILFTYGIYALYKVVKVTSNETRQLQESIVETSGMFQHVKV